MLNEGDFCFVSYQDLGSHGPEKGSVEIGKGKVPGRLKGGAGDKYEGEIKMEERGKMGKERRESAKRKEKQKEKM